MESPSAARRKIVQTAICGLLIELGFDSVNKDALETLIEMYQCFINEVGQLSRNYCELTGRTEPIINDVIMAFNDMEINIEGIDKFRKRANRIIIQGPHQWQPPKQTSMLQSGKKLPLPSHIPQHFPKFPHPHAYIRTPTHKQPVTEYEAIREKAAQQKRDIEKALTKFLARTSQTDNLFHNQHPNIYPLIACKKTPHPYLSALLPQDQIFDPEELEYDPKVDLNNQLASETNATNEGDEQNPTGESEEVRNQKKSKHKSKGSKKKHKSSAEEPIQTENIKSENEIKTEVKAPVVPPAPPPEVIDNPYLRATKMPRKKLVTKIGIIHPPTPSYSSIETSSIEIDETPSENENIDLNEYYSPRISDDILQLSP